MFGLSSGEGMTMTVAQYISPKGNIIQDKGIRPDIEMTDTLNPYISVLLPSNIAHTVSKVDLNKINYKNIKEILQSCPAS